MQSDCLSFRDIPETTRLFRDYLGGDPHVLAFYPPPSVLSEPVHVPTPEHRERVADILHDQNLRMGASKAALANIERLRQGAPAVVTGQQVGILGGPLLGLLKTISAVRVAAQHNAVPVFWLATTDHDIAEVDHANLLCEGALERLHADLKFTPGAIASRAVIASDLIREIERCYPLADAETLAWIAEAYPEGERLGIAFGKLWARLFAEQGLVLLDPDDARFPTAPILRAAAEHAFELNQELRARSAQLVAAGYHEQVLVTPSTTLLFAEIDGVRMPVRMQRESSGATSFKAGHQSWKSTSELAEWVAQHAYLVTPNALLRPVVQDYLLPTLAYVAGPAELAYFAQSKVIYDHLLGAATPVFPRASATLIEARVAQLLAKYNLSFADIFAYHSQSELAAELSHRSLPAEVPSGFNETRVKLGESLDLLSTLLARQDSTLKEAAHTAFRKMEYQLEKLESRVARARLRRESQIERHAQILWNNLRPKKSLQEREIAVVHYLLKYGSGLPAMLAQRLSGTCTGHQIIPI